ncbi:hypothetical protein L6452_30748 [Arctium lappa]|uniref:Uncharacterized protein n=1 Tax=Arctium lappa TaxID=4217 RepID=A0ACB8ZK76_ARCLA|nr:hypothetical protein L6452_30748 [Arctium lappa]
MAHLNDESDSEVNSHSNFSDNSEFLNDDDEAMNLMSELNELKSKFLKLKKDFKQQRSTIQGHQDQAYIFKVLAEEKEEEKNVLKLDIIKLQTRISEQQKEIMFLKEKKLDLTIQYDIVLKDRTEAYTKIKELEDLNYKRGQTEQTLKILTNNQKDTRFYKAKPGLGLSDVDVLKKAPENLYNFKKSSDESIVLIPHIIETFVKPETSEPEFPKTEKEETVEEKTEIETELETQYFKSVKFSYDELNTSYKSNKDSFVEYENIFKEKPESSRSNSNSDKSDSENSEIVLTCSILEDKNESVISDKSNSVCTSKFSDLEYQQALDKNEVLQRQISFLNNTIAELEDANENFGMELDSSFNQNESLQKEIRSLESQIFKLSNGKKVIVDKDIPNSMIKCESSSESEYFSVSSDNISKSVSISDETVKKDCLEQKKTVVEKTVNEMDKCQCSRVDNACSSVKQQNFNKTNIFSRKELLTQATTKLQCSYCLSSSFSWKQKSSKKNKHIQLKNIKSLNHFKANNAEIYSLKRKKNDFRVNKLADVKFVWKWIPKAKLNTQTPPKGPRFEWKIKGSLATLNTVKSTNNKGPIFIWVPKVK